MLEKEKTILRLKNITKKFGEFTALKKINLAINYGEVHVLLGENGAGKSTMMNIISGLYQPTEGEIIYQGKQTSFANPQKAKENGIAMVHQHFMLVDAMTVIENIILSSKDKNSIFLKKESVAKKIKTIQEDYDLFVDINANIIDLSVGEQQKVEIIKALYNDANIFIFDEPTAVLTDEEASGLFRIIRQLVSENKSIIFISHKLREVVKVSDRVSVLRRGEMITTVDTSTMDEQKLADLMIGEKVEQLCFEKKVVTHEPVLALKDVYIKSENKEIRNINLEIKQGEILGVAGVDGNGQSQLVATLTGLIKPQKGKRIYKGKDVNHYKPIDFIQDGIVHIPEDRNKQGLIGDMTIQENIVIKDLRKPEFSRGKGLYLLKDNHEKHANNMIEKYDIRCSGSADKVNHLSGGNQQKVILSRELESEPEVIIAMHPTRGLDIGATNFVHENLIKARDNGCAVVMVSADLDEVMKVSDRMIVMFEGEIMGEVTAESKLLHRIPEMMGGNRFEKA